MKRALLLLLIGLVGCVHAQTSQQWGGTAGAGGLMAMQSNVAPQLQINTAQSCPSGTCTAGVLGQSYSLTLPIQNGLPTYTCSVNAGTLPNGVTLSTDNTNNACVISGTLTPNAGTFTFSIKVVDSTATSAITGNLTVHVACSVPQFVTAAALPPATQGTAYTLTFAAINGTTPYTFNNLGGLPPGITSSGATISGTPTQAGLYLFQETVTDSCNLGAQTTTGNFALQVNSSIAITTPSLASGTVNVAYSQPNSVAGGTGPYTWSITGLPSGLTFSASTGTISGTPTTPGVFTVNETVTDSLNNQATAKFTLTIACAALSISTTSPLANGTVGQPYSQQMTASGGVAPYTWSGPGLPSIGLSIAAATGLITGSPTQAGTLTPTISVTDSCPVSPQTKSGQFTILVNQNAGTLAFTTNNPLNSPVAGQSFSQQLSVSGGVPPYSFSLIGGSFPTGISMPGTAGLISGTATQAVTTAPQLQVTDSNTVPTTVSQTFSMTSVCPALTLTNPGPQTATQGTAFGPLNLNGSGGYGTLTYSAAPLPAGLSISGAAISGTPSASGITNVTASVTDSCSPNPQSASQSFTITVNSNLAITTSTLPTGVNGTSYTASVNAAGGTPPYTFAVTAGTLPTGLSLSSAGAITGTPSAAGTFNFTVRVTDNVSNTATANLSITINGNGLTAGCGAGTGGTNTLDQTTCGNYSGAPYEDLTTTNATTAPNAIAPGTVHNIGGACPGVIVPTAGGGDVFRFTSDINDGAGGTNQSCIEFNGQNSSNFIIDLNGHTLTGGIKFDQNGGGNGIGGATIVNGNITCNLANGGILGCINAVSGGAIASSLMLSHLTVHNINSPTNQDAGFSGFEYAVYTEVDTVGATSCAPGAQQKAFNNKCIELLHSEVAAAFGYAGAAGWCGRCTAFYFAGGTGSGSGSSAEVANSKFPNNATTDAYQGMVFFHVGDKIAHNNNCNWVNYTGSSDSGRCILFDSIGKGMNTSGGSAYNNLIEAFDNRAFRTRLESNINIHDNRIEHVQGNNTQPAVMMGASDNWAENDKGTIIQNNTFMMEGGTAINLLNAYGATASANTFKCSTNCASAGTTLARTDVNDGPSGAATCGTGLVFCISSMSRAANCTVTATLASSPSTSNGIVGRPVNVKGTGTSFDVAGTSNFTITSQPLGNQVQYKQTGCSGSASLPSPPAGSRLWVVDNNTDNFAANGSQIYVKNSTVDPALTGTNLFLACGSGGPSTCLDAPQTDQNGGQTQFQYCNNPAPVAGTGTLVTHRGPDTSCP